MKSNKPKLHGLYAIADTQLLGDRLISAVTAAINGGAKIIQYRDKTQNESQREQQTEKLQSLCLQSNAALIINDDVALAKKINAAGVHLGKHDNSYNEARSHLGDSFIIGISCYNQLQSAIDATSEGANYVAFGSMFPSPTKPQAVRAPLELIAHAKSLGATVCAIGGITHDNAQILVDSGADMIAVISTLFDNQNIKQAAEKFSSLFE